MGFTSALIRRKKQLGSPVPAPAPDPELARRMEELALAVTELQKRSENGRPRQPVEISERLDAVTLRMDQLERRLEQWVSEPPALPPVDQVLAVVENMVAARINGLDERLSDQVHAIELLRNASAQTDALLQKLLTAVEALADQSAERRSAPPVRPIMAEEPEAPNILEREYPVA